MGHEIERKFLVKGLGWKKLTILKTVDIQQGYLSKTRSLTMRIRIANDTAFLTIKGKKVDISVPEYEYEIPYADGVELMKLSITSIIRKTRYYVRDTHDQVWDIDVFKGINRGLTVAEIELDSADQQVILHPWVSTEVSYDKRYVNTYLADHKVPRVLYVC